MAHLHSVYDTDAHFTIHPLTRVVTNITTKSNLVQYDHNSERFTFETPRFVETFDLSLCDRVEIHFINIGKAGKSEDVYLVDDVSISPNDENTIVFSWLVSGNATKYAGSLHFLIRFVCLDGTDIEYAWHTEVHRGITVSDGINNGESEIVEYPDVLETWKQEILAEFKINFDAEKNAAIADIEAKGVATLATIPEDYTALNNQCAKNTVDIAASASRIDRNDKRITNIEKGITPEPYETDASVAYIKEVPEDALPYAEVNKLGGMTRKCTNLTTAQAVYEGADKYLETVVDGRNCIRFTSGYAKKNTPITFKPNTQYTASFYAKSENYGGADTGNACITFFYEDGSFSMLQIGVDTSWRFFTLTSDSGKTVKAIGAASIEWRAYVYLDTDTFMLNEGSTALPYEPYFEGLRSAPVTEVESVGVNMLPFPYYENSRTIEGVTWTVNDDGNITASGIATGYSAIYLAHKEEIPHKPFTISLNETNRANVAAIFRLYDANNTVVFEKRIYTYDSVNPADYPTATCYALLLVRDNNIETKGTFKPTLAIGSTPQPYRPYTRNALPIPEAVQALDGYGWGVNESVYNYIDYEKKQFVKRVIKQIYDGHEAWSAGPTVSGAVRFQLYASPTVATSSMNIVCDQYKTVSTSNTWNDIDGIAVNSNVIEIKDNKYATLAEFKARLAENPITVIFELYKSIITDISDILPEDNYIGVEGGGTLTFKNEYEYDVPSEVTYQIKGATV